MNPFQSVGINTIPSKYTFSLSYRASSAYERRYVVAAHINWVRDLLSSKKVPHFFHVHESLQEDEIQAFLSQGKSTPLGPHWMFLLLTVIKSRKEVETFQSLESIGCGHAPVQSRSTTMTWPQIIDFIGESNFNFIWEQPKISLLTTKNAEKDNTTCIQMAANQSQSSSIENLIQINRSEYIHMLLKSMYINLEESTRSENGSNIETERFPVSNLSQALSVIPFPSEKNASTTTDEFDCFFVFHHYLPFSLHDAVTFSPQKLVSTSRQLFVIYQILQFLRDFHMIGLPLGNLSLNDFQIDECLYLNVIPWVSDILEKLKSIKEPIASKGDPILFAKIKSIVKKVRGWSDYSGLEFPSGLLDPSLVESVIRHWCEGLITNYDYLMFLNYLCGRFCNGNPNFHPVFPWVSDFTHPSGGWRDLTKSKFRLNKGERQLDIMYEEVGGSNERTIAHHVTDILSEITYYVYKARKTPKEVLCKFVRPKWVPAEYPASISRMQEWTPDECIPEFFDDPSMFKSIHDDLPDLQVPKWCSNAEEFIKHHRKLLESDYVSAKLHHWIDLTFGYKLSGSAAVKSKNIYLSLVDSHQYLECHGVVQLFQSPHPPKRNVLRDSRNTVQYKDLKKLRDQEMEEPIQDSNIIDPKTKVWKNINLPKHYDPMGFFNDFEVTMNFFKTHFPYLKDLGVHLTGTKDRLNIPEFVKLFGCLLLELVLPQKIRHVSSSQNIDDKFNAYKAALKGYMAIVPLYCRRAVQIIFDRDCVEFSIPLDISLDLLLMGDKLGPIPFPRYFEDIYKMLRTMRNYEKVLYTAAPDDLVYKSRLQELKVQSFSRDLLQLINNLDNDGIELILPFVIEMFENPESRVLAVWNLFCPFAKVIGRKRSAEHLLYPIIQIYESDYHSDKHLKLFHRTFLLQLSNCFGLRIFLDHFSTLLIEAIGGWKLSDQSDPANRTHLNSTELEIERPDECKPPQKRGMDFKRCESEVGDSQSTAEPEMFVMEPDVSDSESNENGFTTSTNATTEVIACPSVFVNEARLTTGSGENSRNHSPHQASRVPKENARTNSVSSGKSVDLSDLCYESVIWLAHRLGPVLTAKYLTKNLLRMLTLCYLEHLELLEPTNNGAAICEGDMYANKVLDCLLTVSDLYGESFIERQYLPYCIDIVRSAGQKITFTIESALIGVSALLERIFQYISDAILMAQLKDVIMKDILSPITELMCSVSTDFPSGSIPRAVLASKCLSMMNSIRKKIGPDLSQLHLRPVILLICQTFHSTYNSNELSKAEMTGAFDSLLASQIFANFCDVVTGSEFESLIRDLYLQQNLSKTSTSIADDDSPSSDMTKKKRQIDQQSSFASRSFGNKIQIQETDAVVDEVDVSISTKKDSTRHLRGNWLLYWDHEVGRSDVKFNFKQIKLHTFTGHQGSVRHIHALDNENSFLSASKDKTVKLFSLRNQGDENSVSNCQWTYSNHKKAVLSVLFHEPLHFAASTDGFIHIWDPFVGKVIRMLEKGAAKNSPICAIRPILNTSYFVGAGIDSSVHVVDFRTCSAYELKIGIGQTSGLVRCLAVSDSGQTVSVGHSSGMLSTLDLRNGTLLGSWKGHDGEVLQLVPHRNKHLISSSFDQNICVWNLEENKLVFNMRGPTEPVHSLSTFESELISCTTSNRIGIHCGIDLNSDFSSTRLRSDTFKGVVTSMRLLPLNQFLLLGSDSGNIVLLC